MKVFSGCCILGALACVPGGAAKATSQEYAQLKPVPIQAVTLEDSFWSPKRKVWQEVTIPDCFTKFENDRGGAFNNFDQVRNGKSDGHAGPPWYDGLIYEMIRGCADFLAAKADPALENRIDGYIARIAAAQKQRVKANPQVAADKGRMALMRGPLVYCFEGTDNGGAVNNLIIPAETKFAPEHRADLLAGVTVLQAAVTAVFKTPLNATSSVPFKATAVPYYANANRGTSPMQVWIPEAQDGCSPEKQE